MPYFSDGNLTFNTPHDDNTPGWSWDCQQKQDYDPALVRFSSRVYPDGDYICSIYIGDDIIAGTEVLRAPSVDEAKQSVEAWVKEHADKIADVVRSLFVIGRDPLTTLED